jgi:hypothetical protein
MYFSYVEPLKELSLSVSGLRSGFDLYHETTISLSAGMTAFTGLRCGVCVNGFILAIRNYGQATSFDIDVGMQFNAAGDLSFGFVMQNLTSGTIGVAKERLPQALSSGISYQPIAAASLTLDLVKDSRFPLETRFGVEYIAADIVPIRAGIATEPSMLSAGLGIHTSLVEIDYAMTEHPELGLTHQFSLTLRLGGG